MESMERTINGGSEKSYPMIGGEGPYSYANASIFYQQRGLDIAKAMLSEEIIKKLDVKQLCSSSNSLNIADLGCSIGPNTFFTVQNIIQSIQFNSESLSLKPTSIEFQVFFNDHTVNDFNTLIKSLPPERNYFAAAVPGTFYGRLFPENSLQFVNSSYALEWLSKVPDEVADKSSAAWNSGRIIHGGSKEVEKAYSSQFGDDMEKFLRARATEIVYGGFMSLLLPCIPNGAHPSQCSIIATVEVLESSLTNLAKRGLVDEAEVESFNLPFYLTSPAELESLIQRNGCFKIERIDQFLRPMADTEEESVDKFALCVRAGYEAILTEHFGSEIIDHLFNHYTQKLAESGIFSSDSHYIPMFDLFVFLKRIDG